MEIDQNLKNLLIQDEGFRLKPYTDIMGKLTIGVGRNLTDVGLSEAEIEFLLNNDIANAYYEAIKAFPWLSSFNSVRQDAIISMVFNMGIEKLKEFKKTLDYLKNLQCEEASKEMLNSQWAVQVRDRAKRLSFMIRTGQYP